MNYRHAYHAGNFADVHKHIVLTLVIRHLALKETPFRVIDLHAGRGLYALSGKEASKSGEWRQGIGLVLEAAGNDLEPAARSILEPYLSLVSTRNETDRLTHYPGSPVIARRMLRDGDVLVANELHPADHASLAKLFARDRQVRIMHLDAWTAVKSLLPPKERRGVVLFDPPFEEPREFERLVAGLGDGLDRFAAGTYLLWYPIKDRKPVDRFHRRVSQAITAPTLMCEVLLHRANNPDRLNGSGLLIVNPPYTLKDALSTVGTPLVSCLTTDPAAEFRLDWLIHETTGAKVIEPAARPQTQSAAPNHRKPVQRRAPRTAPPDKARRSGRQNRHDEH